MKIQKQGFNSELKLRISYFNYLNSSISSKNFISIICINVKENMYENFLIWIKVLYIINKCIKKFKKQ